MAAPTTGVRENLTRIRASVEAACARCGRDPGGVSLIAVSKGFPAWSLREATAAGQLVFGENRVQEAVSKMDELGPGLEWHFIGGLQRNKVRLVLQRFDYVHSVASLRLAQAMDRVAAELDLTPKVFFQVNMGNEATKGGFSVGEIKDTWFPLRGCSRLRPMGLMCIPPLEADPASTRRWFSGLRSLRDELVSGSGVPLPFLSMGMSGDFEVAIEEGATHIRVGSAIFGERAGAAQVADDDEPAHAV